MLLTDLQERAKLIEMSRNEHPTGDAGMDIPPHIIEQLGQMFTDLMQHNPDASPEDAAFEVVMNAELAGVEDDIAIRAVAADLLKTLGNAT